MNNTFTVPFGLFEELFPFYFSLNKELNLVRTGKSLSKLINPLKNSYITEVFKISRPFSLELNFESFLEYSSQIFVLFAKNKPELVLRGQFIVLNQQELVFVGSPWITDAQVLEKLDLLLSDFALHDPITDLLQVLKAKDLAMSDAKRLVLSLEKQRANLIQSEESLKLLGKRLSVLIQNMQSGILVESQDRKIVLANELFCSLFGIPIQPEQLTGLDCSQSAEQAKHLFLNEDQFAARIDELLQAKQICVHEMLIMKNGRVLERDYIPIFEGGHYMGNLWQYKDVTDRKRQEKELIEAKETAVASRKAKEQFLANMSHEIRTPINIISGLTNLTLETELNPTQRENLDIIRLASENLLSIVNDILDFEKIDSGKLELCAEEFSLNQCLNEVAKMMRNLAEKKGVLLVLEQAYEKEIWVNADKQRLKQMLLNLVNNAIKFTDKGFVKLSSCELEKGNGRIWMKISVQDSGIGIEQEQIPLIFKRFTQAKSDTTRKYGGTGLGLTIVQRLAELFGGSIEVESQVGLGSTFSLKIPFEELKMQVANQEIQQKTGQEALPLRGKRVLVVDDNSLNIMLVSKVLKKWDLQVLEANNGLQALEKLALTPVDLVLMDIQMPEMDGLEATRRIRSSKESWADLPIVGLSANLIKSEIQLCIEVGMNGYLSKPFKQDELFTELSRLLNKAGENEAIGLDLTYLEDLACGDEDFMLESLLRFGADLSHGFQEMEKAMLDRDLANLAKCAHRLRPIASYVGVPPLDDTLKKLELEANNGGDVSLLSTKMLVLSKDIHEVCHLLDLEIAKRKKI